MSGKRIHLILIQGGALRQNIKTPAALRQEIWVFAAFGVD
jgi:hypothetical protein